LPVEAVAVSVWVLLVVLVVFAQMSVELLFKYLLALR
tara:strand:- start:196 stop:306 length:111 start_codon:yes stop_codon:yes gene_type:complete